MASVPSSALPTERPAPSDRSTVGLFIFVILAWSLNWVVMKVAVQDITPLWAVTIRTALAAAVLIPALHAKRLLVPPPRADYSIVLVISLFHMVAFATLMTAGLAYVSAGRAIVLGYTTPLWVAPGALLFLKERMSIRQVVGIAIGMPASCSSSGPAPLTGTAEKPFSVTLCRFSPQFVGR